MLWLFCWFGQVKINLTAKSPKEKLGAWATFWTTYPCHGLPPWLLRSVKIPTSSELYPSYFRLRSFLNCLGIKFFHSLPFPNTVSRLPLVTYASLCSTFVTYGTLCYGSGHQMLSTQPLPREAEDFPKRWQAF